MHMFVKDFDVKVQQMDKDIVHFRLTFIYYQVDEPLIIFTEFYYKSKQKIEDKDRIEKALKWFIKQT